MFVGDKHVRWWEIVFLCPHHWPLALLRFIYRSSGLAGLALEDGIKVLNENGPVAFIPFIELSNLVAGGAGQRFQGVHSQGWYVIVRNLGAYAGHAGQNLYSVQIYNAAGALMGQFNFGN